jgi:3-methyladenine DNA glycosylase AlkC
MTTLETPLADLLFNRDKVAQVAAEIGSVHCTFQRDAFVEDVMGRFSSLRLKERIRWISECLERYLPQDYRSAVQVLLAALPPPCDPTLSDGDSGDFIYAPFSAYVARRGCGEADLNFSLTALREITTRFSAEEAIRTFINAYPDHTMNALLQWTSDNHYHVRRLCSEGTRPRLPWASRLALPTTAGLPILDRLYADPTRFVTRSVANHLNDITKTDPDAVIQILQGWRDSGNQTKSELDYIVRHATRSLVKVGHHGALELLGVGVSEPIAVSRFEVPRHVQLDSELPLSLTIRAKQDTEAIVDYVVHFQGASGRLTKRKVYKLRRITLPAGKDVTITKRHPIRSNMTTRAIYPGRHEIEVLVNGTVQARREFWISESEPSATAVEK